MSKTSRKPKSIHVDGRIWFRKSAGNSYSSARVYVDGELFAICPETSGYGTYYVQMAGEALDAAGLMPGRETYRSGRQSLQGYCADHGIKLTYESTNVPRERDLDREAFVVGGAA